MKSGPALAVLVCLTAGIGAAAPAAAQQEDPCAVPEALSQSGATTAARREYVMLLKANPSLQCGLDGLAALNEEQDPPTAEQLAQPFCDQAEAYIAAHRDDDAVAAYKQALEEDPSEKSCGALGLQDLAPWWASRTVDDGMGAAPKALAVLGAALIAGLLVLMLGYTRVGARLLARTPIAKTILRPRLTLGDLTDQAVSETDQGLSDLKIGAAVTGRIRERLQRYREDALDEEGLNYSLDFGTSTQDLADIVSDNGQLRNSLSKLGDVSEHTRIVAAVVDALIAALPIKRFAVSGIVEPATGPSASSTLALEAGPRLVNAVTLTGRTVPEPPVRGSDYLALASAAAVWIQYGVARELARATLGPAETAESYALVLEGISLYDATGHDDEAIKVFERALALDQNNMAAKLNLAMAYARLRHDYATAEAILSEGLDEIRSTG